MIPKEQYQRITAEMSGCSMADGGNVGSVIEHELRLRKICKTNNCTIQQYRNAHKMYSNGGNIAKENRDMVANNNKQIAHHTKELEKALGDGKRVPAWVVAKVNRSASDLSDATHYLEGSEEKMAKGGNVHYYLDKDSYRMGRPNSLDKDLLNKVGYESFKSDFVGNFGWMTPNKKLADGYLFKLDSFDQNLVKDIKLKSGERIFRYFNNVSAISGYVPFIKINLEKGLLYFMLIKDFGDDSIQFETKGIKAEWVNLIEDKMAQGGNLEIGAWVAEKKGTARGQVYYDFGEFVKIQDKYGNQSNTLYSKKNLKKSVKPRYAEGGITRNEYISNKVGKVMHEFKEGELHSGSGAKVTDRKQAIAIGLSEGKKGWKHRRKK